MGLQSVNNHGVNIITNKFYITKLVSNFKEK